MIYFAGLFNAVMFGAIFVVASSTVITSTNPMQMVTSFLNIIVFPLSLLLLPTLTAGFYFFTNSLLSFIYAFLNDLLCRVIQRCYV